ncbi:DUF1853 family protein [Salinivibrio proteolyticus]|uniref:DUF1853 family protein n=1 Tax=Salinivibrio proteolyticus TaxID=334715 RepID=UPI000988E80E|nr:DUF1853 family protein [Salinivibrio proteolyticus]
MMTSPLFARRQQIAKDMAWIRSQPPLLSSADFPMVNTSTWQVADNTLADMSYHGPHRIGFYYQWLLGNLIAQQPHLNVVAEEIQINDAGKTVGAVDFLIENGDQLEHWEVAVKFYLAHQGRWLGPNAKDALDIKAARMMNHQLAMSNHPRFLADHPQWRPQKKRLCIHGRLYQPFHQNAPLPDAPCVNLDCITGWWCWPDALPQDRRYASLSRDQWLSIPDFHTLPRFDTAALASLTRTCHLVDEYLTPWFVVTPDWPQTQPPKV